MTLLLQLTLMSLAALTQTGQTSDSPTWEALAQNSSAVVVGTVRRVDVVVRRDKMLALPEGYPQGHARVDPAKIEDYILGTVFEIQIAEFLKDDKEKKKRRTLFVFVDGPAGSGALAVKGMYILFLAPLKTNKNFARTEVDPNGKYAVVQSPYGRVRVSSERSPLIGTIKEALSEKK